MTGFYLQGSGDTVDYGIDWSDFLEGVSPIDSIATSNWSAGGGIALANGANSTTQATIEVSGGTAGRDYVLTNTVTTTGGRTKSQQIVVRIE